MLALHFANGIALQETQPPSPGPGEALVRVRLAGICNTDLEIVRGYMAFAGILGHEFVGEVTACQDPAWRGRRVVGEINIGCGTCDLCARDLGRHCAQRSVLGIMGKHGCFAEYLTLPVANLLQVPDALSDEQAVFTEPVAAGFEILEQRIIRPAERVVVLGDGKLGTLIAQVIAQTGAQLVVVGKHPHKLAKLAARGIETARPGMLAPRSQDLVVEATGAPSGLAAAIDLVRPRGTIVLKSTFHGPVSIDTAPLIIHEIQLLGSRCGRFAPALEAMRAGTVDPRMLIDHTLPLRDGIDAMQRALQPGTQKVLLDMREPTHR